MNYGKRIFISMFWVLLGAALVGCNLAGAVDEFWSSMGFALIVTGLLQLVRHARYRTDPAYREKVDTENHDERNRFIANKAWAWAGYFFVLIAAAATVVLKLLGRDDLMLMASGSVCLIVLLYWGSYMYLRRKY